MIRHLTALVGLICFVIGCAGADLTARIMRTRSDLEKARRSGAYGCSPKDLAKAESALEMAERQLDRGEYFIARDYLDEATTATERVVRLTSTDTCADHVGGTLPRSRPTLSEDDKGFLDSDGDGIPDHRDHCPADPEDQDGYEDEDGCPDPDNDKDGILDVNDACPNEPEDRDGFEDSDGCPDPDNDQDGILDGKDKCPNEPEDMDGFEDGDGCPDPDNDKDGILDQFDACPNEYGPENPNGCHSQFNFIEVTAEKIALKQAIFFKTGKSSILAKSHPLLDEVTLVLRSRPTLHVRIEGHTDLRGNRSQNLQLSQSRAESVRLYLTGHGISGDRMEARGYGPDRPIDSNSAANGRERNRRVEFLITKQ